MTTEVEVPKKEIITEAMYTAKWKSMLKIFHSTVEGNPAVSKVSKDLMDLSNEAVNTHHLTAKQRLGITERCSNYINGSYGRNLSILAN